MSASLDDPFTVVGSVSECDQEAAPTVWSGRGDASVDRTRSSRGRADRLQADSFAMIGGISPDLDEVKSRSKSARAAASRRMLRKTLNSASKHRSKPRPWVPRKMPLLVGVYKDWEPAYSLIGRLAARNGISAANLASDYGLSLVGVQNGRKLEVNRLAFLADVDAELLRNATMCVGGKARVAKQLRGESWNSRFSERGRGVVCAQCLEDDRIADPRGLDGGHRRRVWWDLRPLHHCPRHRHRLEPMLAKGSSRIDVSGEAAISHDCAWEAYVLGRLGFGDRVSSDLLDKLELEAVFELVAACGAVIVHGIACRRSAGTLIDDPIVMQSGFEAIRTKSAFLAMLKELCMKAKSILGTKTPREVFGRIYDLIDYKRNGSMAPLAPFVVDFASANIPKPRHSKMLGRSVEWSSVVDGKSWDHGSTEEVPIARKRVIRIGSSLGLLNSNRRAIVSGNSIPQAVVDEVLDLLKSTIGTSQLCDELGLTEKQWTLLLRAGLIEPVHRISDTGKERHRYAKDAARVFMEGLAGAAPVVARGKAGWATIFDAARGSLPFIIIIEALMDGRLIAKCRLGGVHGLLSILVSLDEVRTLQLAVQQPKNSISVEEFARRLDMHPNIVRRLIVHGAVATVDGGSKRQRWVDEAEFHRFDNVYVQSTKLKRLLGSPRSANLSHLLETYGIVCAIPEVKHHLNFYRRSDIIRAGLPQPELFSNRGRLKNGD